jgi:uncharacterized protein (TIGR03000 family)
LYCHPGYFLSSAHLKDALMLTTFAVLAGLTIVPAQTGDLALTNGRFTYGIQGPTRADKKFLPGDSLVLCFQINGARADADGQANYAIGLEVVDDKGKLYVRQAPRQVTRDLSSRGKSPAAFAQVQIGLDQPAGNYLLKVSVTDAVAQVTKVLSEPFEVLPKAFGIVRLTVTGDSQATTPTERLVRGRSFWVTLSLVGFSREEDRQQPQVAVALRVLDERGKAVLPKPIVGEVTKDISPRAPSIPMQFVVRLQQAGKFTLELKATDQIKDRSSTLLVPITVSDALPADAAAQQTSGTAGMITLVVPADAEVFFDDYPTVQRGTERLYSTPLLANGKTYEYAVRARWTQDGKSVEQTRKVSIRGGASAREDFLQPLPGGGTTTANPNTNSGPGPSDPNAPPVATLVTETGTLLRRGNDASHWETVATQTPLRDGDFLVGLPGAAFDSTGGAVRLTMHSDFEGRSLFPALESAVRLLSKPNVDLALSLDRGRVDLVNRKQTGAAHALIHVRDQTWELTLAKPGTQVALDLVGRWSPGRSFAQQAGHKDAPTLVLAFVVLSGEAMVRHAGMEHALSAPPGLALIAWDSVTGPDDRPHYLEKLPAWAVAGNADSAAARANKAAVQRLRKSLATKGVTATLEALLSADDPDDRRTAIFLLAALDDAPRLANVLREVKHPELLDAGILALRHWIGRGPGHDQALFNGLVAQSRLTPEQSATLLTFLHSPGLDQLARPEYIQALAAYLDHNEPLIRGLAFWHLSRLLPAGREFGYNPLSPKETRAAAVQKWKQLVGKTSGPSKKQASLLAVTWFALALLGQQPSPADGGGPPSNGGFRNMPQYTPNYQTNLYGPYAGPSQYGPVGGGLTGASNVIDSQGQLMIDQQQAYLMQQQYHQQQIQTRYDQLNEYLYERRVLPNAVDNEERNRIEQLRWARDDPPMTEIWSGVALNQLLVGIQRQLAQGVARPDVPLDPSVVQQINVIAGQSGGNLALIADQGRLQWPLALYTPTFEPYKTAMDALARTAYQQARNGPVPDQTIVDLTTAVNNLQTALQNNVDNMDANTFITGQRFVNDLQTLTQTLQNPAAGNYLNGTWTAKGATVSQLVQNMTADGLRFGAALPGQDSAYLALQRAMAAYYLGPNPNHPWDPLDK